MYEGHLPEGNAVQKHSAGELYPVVIVGYGDGTWRWVDEARKTASHRSPDHRSVVAGARYYRDNRDILAPWGRDFLHLLYEEYLEERA